MPCDARAIVGRSAACFKCSGLGAVAIIASLVAVPACAAYAVPRGAIKQLRGRAGCAKTDQFGRPREGCAAARGLAWLGGDLAISPDGRNVYVASFGQNELGSEREAIAVFARDPHTGRLDQLAGGRGCLARTRMKGCSAPFERGGFAMTGVVVSPDGRNVYVGSAWGLMAFARDRDTGALTQLPGELACAEARSSPAPDDCDLGQNFVEFRPSPISVSGDGRSIYLGGERGITLFSRDPATGGLTRRARFAKGRAARETALAGDGTSAYTSTVHRYVGVFARAPSGELTDAGCVGTRRGCRPARGIGRTQAIAVSPDDRHVYATSVRCIGGGTGEECDAIFGNIGIYRRNRATGRLTQLRGKAGCIDDRPRVADCAPGYAIASPSALTVSHDGRNVYVGADANGAISVFHRNRRRGRLRQLPGRAGCAQVARARVDGWTVLRRCARARGLGSVDAVEGTGDGRNVYAFSGSGLVAFSRRSR
ncbi:MAG: trimeric autotransporter adhesin [Acidobacteriota bacterium]|nr:trimeric autotransporter adhesin [Acidobacteriota bacterium]